MAGKVKTRDTVYDGIEQTPDAFMGLFTGLLIKHWNAKGDGTNYMAFFAFVSLIRSVDILTQIPDVHVVVLKLGLLWYDVLENGRHADEPSK